MAIVSNNDLTLGLRGRVGKYFVFRVVGGRTIASHAPRRPDPRKQSDAQRKTRATFKEAAAWAVQALRDPELRCYFMQRARALGLTNAYTAAVQHRMQRSGRSHGNHVSIIEKPAMDEKPPSAIALRAPVPVVWKDVMCYHQRSLLLQTSIKPGRPNLKPTPTHSGMAYEKHSPGSGGVRGMPVVPKVSDFTGGHRELFREARSMIQSSRPRKEFSV